MALKSMFGEGALDPSAKVDDKALWKNHDETSEVHGEYLDTCAQLVIEGMLKK